MNSEYIEKGLLTEEEAERLDKEVESLIVRSYNEGMSPAEIAHSMDYSYDYVCDVLFRSFRKEKYQYNPNQEDFNEFDWNKVDIDPHGDIN